jgi:imidazolonepropionase-like amidohydrolase
MTSPEVLRDQTVLVENGRIVALGPASTLAVPHGARRIEGDGRYLMPGLIDMHAHVWDTPELTLYVAYGVTTVRNMWGTPSHLSWRELTATGKLLGPKLYTAGPILDGEPPTWPAGVLTDEQAAREEVQREKRAGYDFIKVYDGLRPEVWRALLDEAKKHRMPVVGHPPLAVGIEGAVAQGQATVEHLYGLEALAQRSDSPTAHVATRKERRQAWPHVDPTRLDDVARRLARSGTAFCPTLVLFKRHVAGAEARRLYERPEMRFVFPLWRSWWTPTDNDDASVKTSRDAWPLRLRAVRALHQAGAKLLVGTDSGNPFIIAGEAVHEELALLVDAGLSPYEALKAATRDAAEVLGDTELGTIELGKRADLLLLEKNPLDDIRNTTERTGVMVQGRWYSNAELTRRLEGIARGYRALSP